MLEGIKEGEEVVEEEEEEEEEGLHLIRRPQVRMMNTCVRARALLPLLKV
jgi:hypothetical protein